ncbi:MAG: M23 family metallopeptidase [Oscillospiraceae bacterium]|nr:M23 family metallopeptidase [Oscillospiraceae bacterium]
MMERDRRQSTVRRRRGQPGTSPPAGRAEGRKTRRIACKLTICAALFLLSALLRILFPGFFATVGNRITTAVDYRTALSILGEGISGERQFISAIGEAFTYAFRGVSDEIEVVDEHQDDSTVDADSIFGGLAETGDTYPWGFMPEDSIVSAFLETQARFSHLALPAGTTFEMPVLDLPHVSPVSGVVISQFGFGEDAFRGGISFRHGVIIAADADAPVAAFADGEVIAAGESAVLGQFVIIAHNGAETRYGHLGEIFVDTGQMVNMGDEIAKAGASGNIMEPGLSFELRIGGVAVNPEYYIFAG